MKRRFSASSAKSAGPLMENMDSVTEHITATVKNQVMQMNSELAIILSPVCKWKIQVKRAVDLLLATDAAS